MASGKREQIIEEAEKLAARGKLDAAIKQYMRAVDQLPSDTNSLNRLGDLLVKVDRIPEAIEVYQRIAEHFATDGFFLKSIAIYKKVNRLDPRRTETYERLADLYFKQGLVVEGRQQLQTLADWFLRAKQSQDAVRVYRRLVELEPANLQARAKLVDLSLQLGDVAGVGAEIDALGRSLLGRGMLDEAVKLHRRILELGPEQAEFVAPCVDALIAAGRKSQAVELAKLALATSRGGIELQRAAARALVESGETDEAAKLLEGLIGTAGEHTDVIQLYGDVMIGSTLGADAKTRLLPLVDRLLKVRDVARAATLVKKLVAGVPGDPEVLERALAVFEELEDTPSLVGIGKTLAEGYLGVGRRADAIALYRRLVAEAPGDRDLSRRLAELDGGPPAPVPEAPPAAPAVAAADEDLEFVDVEFGPAADEAGAAVAPPPPRPEPEPQPAGALTEPSLASANAKELYAEAVVFAKYGLTDKAVVHLQRLLALDPAHEEGRDLLASLGVVPAVPPSAPVAPAADTPPPAPVAAAPIPVPPVEFPAAAATGVPAEPGFDPFSGMAPLPPAPAPTAGAAPMFELSRPVPELDLGGLGTPLPASRPRPEPAPAAALPSFDDLLVPPAPPLRADPAGLRGRTVRLDDLEAILGLRQPARRRPPAPADGDAAAPAAGAGGDGAATVRLIEEAPPPEPLEAPDVAMQQVEVSGVLVGPSQEQLRELDFLIQQGLLDDAAKLLQRLDGAYPEHPDVLARQAMLKARGWDEERRGKETSTAAELFSEEEQFFDLAAELEKELADEELVAEATGSGKSNEVSIEELFKEFQRGVAEQVEEEDFDTHFNLGLAYREMGLLEEAIGEFQLSARSPDYLMESASMIGACYLENGLAEQAAEWYQRALTAPSLPPEAELGLRYELGRAHELAGNTTAALACFSEVLAINPAFRDVVARVSKLRSN
jgi:tetratricopeptide (TPR) repeat protein